MCDYNREYYIAYKCPHPDYGPGKNEEETFCIFHSDREDKDVEKFYQEFKKLYKSGKHDFAGFIFPEGFNFLRLEEKTGKESLKFNEADFFDAKFSGNAIFILAEFSERTNFERATFSGEADFYYATFSGGVNLKDATFWGEANFLGATFSERTYFKDAKFWGEANFWGVTFSEKSKVHFQGNTFEESAKADFSNLEIEKGADLTFNGVNLKRANFLGTDLNNINFNEISWLKSRKLAKRNMVYDEIFQSGLFQRLLRKLNRLFKKRRVLYEKDNHYEVQQLYNLLRINYEKTGRYHEAGDFFVGAMEMRRKGTREGILTRFILFLYMLISLYGERPIRAFGWLIFLIFVSGLVNLNAGIKEEIPLLFKLNPKVNVEIAINLGKSNSETEIIQYKCSDLNLSTFADAEFWNDYLSALSVSLSIFTLKRVESSYHLSDPRWGPIILAIQTALAAMFLSLFILAMNRKFRRTKD